MALQHGTENIVTDGYDELVLNLDAANKKSFNSDGVGTTVNAQTAYTTSGTSTFQVPVGITSISAVCVGGGGGGGGNGWNNTDAGAGGGGGLSYGTFAVTPGETLTIVVGAQGTCAAYNQDGTSGENSQIKRGSTVLLQGGGGAGGTRSYASTYGTGGDGGTSTGTERDGGGTGGDGGNGNGGGGGGGGAAGYSGNGGEGKSFPGAGAGGDGAGGGGGGAGANGSSGNSTGNNKGGGVGILGEGSNGAGGAAYNAGSPGSGGSGETYGGGGGGAYRNTFTTGKPGGVGAVRLVYQPIIGTRQYPTLANIADTTYSGSITDWKDLDRKNDATLEGAIFNTDNKGNILFDGTNDYVTFKPESDIAFGTGQFAVEIWANFVGEGPFYFIDTRNSSQTSSRWALFVQGSEKLEWYTGSTSYFSSDGSMPTWSTGNNGWNHIVFSREGTGSNQLKAYVNGEYKSAVTDTTNYTNSSSEASIGRRYSNTEFLDGKISVLKIYKGKALSASEVLQNYNALKVRYF